MGKQKSRFGLLWFRVLRPMLEDFGIREEQNLLRVSLLDESAPPALPLRPQLDIPRFACDVHLGRLAAYLRMLGYDTRYSNAYDDAELVATAGAEGRVLLTRDRGLLKRSGVVYGAFVRATEPQAQLRELAARFELRPSVRLFPLACTA